MVVCFEVYDDRGCFDRYWEIKDLLSFSCSEEDGKVIYQFVPKLGVSFSVNDDHLVIYYIHADNF